MSCTTLNLWLETVKRKTQRQRLPARLLGFTLVLGACGLADSGGRQPISLADVQLFPDGRTLSVGVNSCNGTPTADVDQGTDEVRITAEAYIPGGDDQESCMDEVTVELAELLGNRRVVDGISGQELEVERLE